MKSSRERLGEARPGTARQGEARQGEGANGTGGGSVNCGQARHGKAGRGMARQGSAWQGLARHGKGTNGAFTISECPMRKADKMTKARKQFEEDPEIAERLEKLKAATKDLSRGHMLMWEVVEALLVMERDDDRLRYAVHKWRKYVHHELRIETWAIPGQGIKLLTESEQVSMLPQKRARKAYRQHGLILRSIKNTNIQNLSDHERRMAAAIIENSRNARKATNRVSNTTRGKIPNDRQALIDRAKQVAAESS